MSSVTGKVPRLETLLKDEFILLDVPALDFSDVATHMVDRLIREGVVPPDRSGDLLEKIMDRERIASTAIGAGMACPHAFVDYLERPVVLFARLEKPLDLSAPDGIPTDLIFLLVGRHDDARGHLRTLMHLARLMQDGTFLESIRLAESSREIVRDCVVAEGRIEEPPAPSTSLVREGIEQRTGRFAGGVLDDIRRRLPLYKDDYRQGLNLKSLAATIFLFFACFSGAVTFGALMAASTGNAIGPFEMILATAVCGVIYAVCAGQPLVILGGTGPILIFTKILYDQCLAQNLDFMPVYACVGLWSAGFTIVLALTDASVVLRWVTRFTDEVFVLLMAAIFLDEAFKKLVQQFVDLKGIGGYASALSAVVIALGTLGIALVLREARKGSLLRGWMRNFLADFGTVIAMLAMTLLAIYMMRSIEGLTLDTIQVPDTFSVRLVSMGDLPLWVILGAAIPAAFLTILIFLTQQITAKVCNSPEFNLTKGPGYHLDLLVVGVLLVFCSLLGLPWMCGATVRSLNHVNALATTHVADATRGGTEVTDGVLENRITGIAIHVLVAASLLLLSILKLVPMACLYGIFLYMGIVSFAGNQFWQRLTLWVREPALYPPSHYLRRVPTRTVHMFTLVQLIGFAALWAVKIVFGLLLPLVLALLVPLRLFLDRVLDPTHLEILDAEETPEDEIDHWA